MEFCNEGQVHIYMDAVFSIHNQLRHFYLKVIASSDMKNTKIILQELTSKGLLTVSPFTWSVNFLLQKKIKEIFLEGDGLKI